MKYDRFVIPAAAACREDGIGIKRGWSKLIRTVFLAVALSAATISGAFAQIISERPEAQIVIQWYELLNAGNVDEAFELVGDDFIQHNPNAPVDKEGNVAMFSQMAGAFNYDIRRVISEGDHVVVHGVITFAGASPTAAADFFRIADGKIVEHWDVLQPIPEDATNPTPML